MWYTPFVRFVSAPTSYRITPLGTKEVLHWSPDLKAMTNNSVSPHVRSVSRHETPNVPTATGPPGNNQDTSPGRDVLAQLGTDDITRPMLAHRDEVATQGASRRIYLDLLSCIGMESEPSRLMELRLGLPLDVRSSESLTTRYSRTERQLCSLSEPLEENYSTVRAHNTTLTTRALDLDEEIRGVLRDMATLRVTALDSNPRRANVTEPIVSDRVCTWDRYCPPP